MNKAKVGTIIAGIIDVLIGVVVAVGSILGFFLYSQLVDPLVILASLGIYLVIMFGVFSITAIIGIVIFIFAIFEIRIGAKNDSDYYRSKATITTYIVLDFIFAGLLIVPAFFLQGIVMIVTLSAAAVLLISAILKIIDLSVFKHKLKKGKVDVKVHTTVNQTATNTDLNPSFKLKLELARLDNLKSEGSITQAEYDIMRQNIINNFSINGAAPANNATAPEPAKLEENEPKIEQPANEPSAEQPKERKTKNKKEPK